VFNAEDDPQAVLLRNASRVESFSDPISAVASILKRLASSHAAAFRDTYGVPESCSIEDADSLLKYVAARRGRLSKGGEPLLEDAARCVLRDWTEGKIPFYCKAPEITAVDDVDDAAGDWGRAAAMEWDCDTDLGGATLAATSSIPSSSRKVKDALGKKHVTKYAAATGPKGKRREDGDTKKGAEHFEGWGLDDEKAITFSADDVAVAAAVEEEDEGEYDVVEDVDEVEETMGFDEDEFSDGQPVDDGLHVGDDGWIDY